MDALRNAWNAAGDVALWAYEELRIYRRKRPPRARLGRAQALVRLAAADYRQIERVSDVSVQEFTQRYLMQAEPVIISDGLRDWRAPHLWSFEYFCREFGDVRVQLQDSGFKPRDWVELRTYLKTLAGLPAVELGQMSTQLGYLRYTYDSFLKHLLFTWGFGDWVRTQAFSFVVYRHIRDHWCRPYFLPASGYRVPWVQWGMLRPNERMCQDWGLYFSAPGACTRLHVDGMRTNAVLCQVKGRKAGWIFSASLEDAVRDAAEGNVASAPTQRADSPCAHAQGSDRVWRFELEPGEIMLIPRGLAHEVHTLSPSISLTYNFLTSGEYLSYFANKRERGSGWIASAPIAAAGFDANRRAVPAGPRARAVSPCNEPVIVSLPWT